MSGRNVSSQWERKAGQQLAGEGDVGSGVGVDAGERSTAVTNRAGDQAGADPYRELGVARDRPGVPDHSRAIDDYFVRSARSREVGDAEADRSAGAANTAAADRSRGIEIGHTGATRHGGAGRDDVDHCWRGLKVRHAGAARGAGGGRDDAGHDR